MREGDSMRKVIREAKDVYILAHIGGCGSPIKVSKKVAMEFAEDYLNTKMNDSYDWEDDQGRIIGSACPVANDITIGH